MPTVKLLTILHLACCILYPLPLHNQCCSHINRDFVICQPPHPLPPQSPRKHHFSYLSFSRLFFQNSGLSCLLSKLSTDQETVDLKGLNVFNLQKITVLFVTMDHTTTPKYERHLSKPWCNCQTVFCLLSPKIWNVPLFFLNHCIRTFISQNSPFQCFEYIY